MGNFKRTMVTLLACFTVLCLSIGFFPWATLTKTASADAATQAGFSDVNGNGSIDYVAFGDSVANGYGQPGYYLKMQKHEKEGHVYNESEGKCYLPNGTLVDQCTYAVFGGQYTYTTYLFGGNVAGYLVNAPEAYPSKVAAGLESATGKNVNLMNMAVSGMRIEELRLLLDKDYKGDGYTRRKFFADRTVDTAAESYFDWTRATFSGGELYLDLAKLEYSCDHNSEIQALYDDFLHDYVFEDKTFAKTNNTIKNVAEIAAEYQYAIKNADLISIGLGTNNFGTASETALYRMIGSIFNAPGPVGDTYDYNYDLEGLLAQYPTMVEFVQDVQAKLLSMLRLALGEGIYNDYIVAIQDVVDTYAYGLIGFISNYKVVLDKIHALNPNAKIVLVGATNMEYGLEFEMNGIKIPFGDIYETLIQTANLWLNNYACTFAEKPNRNSVYFAQPETSPEVIMNDIGNGIWNRYVVSYMTNDIASRFNQAGFTQQVFAQLLNVLGMKYDYVGEYDLNDMDLLAAAFEKIVAAFAPGAIDVSLLRFGRNEQRYPYVLLPDNSVLNNDLTGLLQVYDVAMQLLTAMEKSAREITTIDLTAVAGLMFDNNRLGSMLSDPTQYESEDAQQFLYFFARMMFASAAGVHPSQTGSTTIANEIIDTLVNDVTAAERLEEKIEIIKTTYVTAVREAIANTFSSQVVGTIDAIGKWFNNNGYDKKVIEYAFKLQAAIDNNTPNVAKQVIGEALAEIQSIKAEAIAPESYTVNEDSYYVSIGDSQITGHGLTGYENYGYNTYVEGAAPYELAKALFGEEAQSRYKQLCMGGLRADDLRWILDPSFAADAYSTNYVLGNLSSYAGATTVEQAREIFVSELQKADLISLSIGGGNITTYVGQQINNVLSTGNRPLYTNDWSRYLTAEGEPKVLGIIENVAGLAIQKLGLPVDGEGYAEFMGKRVHVETLIKVTVESVIYGYFGFSVNLPEVVELVQEINPTAKLLVLGYFNPVDEMTVTLGEGEGAIVLPVGQFVSQFVKLTNTQTSLLSLMNDSVTYVDVKDASCFFDKTVQEGGDVTIMDYMGAVFQNSHLTHADLDGHAYIKNQMLAGLTVTCAHVWTNACDAICNTCGHTRTPSDHVYDNACDADCNVCGEERTPSDHVYTDCEDEICNVCGEIRVKPGHDWDDDCDTDCNNCDVTREVPHVWDNACDAECNACGHTRTPSDHVWTNACDADCNVCGQERTPSDHVWTNDCDADCNVCGQERTPSDHVWTNACDADCNVCGERRTPSDHVFDNDCHDQSCNVCGEIARAYAEHVFDGVCDNACNNCAYTREQVPHTFDDDCQDVICNVCGHEAREAAEHVYVSDCDTGCENCAVTRTADPHTFDDDCHDQTCNLCGETARAFAEHVFDAVCDNTCNNCAYTREQAPHTFDNDCQDVICNVCGKEAREAAEHVYSAVCDVTCENCDVVRVAEPHTYAHDCSTICSVCGDVREASVAHTYDFDCDTQCNVCGEERAAEHVYDHNCDVDCNLCGDVRTPYEHVYDGPKDEKCNVCGFVREREVLPGFDFGCAGYVDGVIAVISLAGIALVKVIADKKRK